MEKIVYAGSFDPLTNGHWWVIKNGLEIAKKVLVFVAENPNKKTMFTAKQRQKMIQDVTLSEGLENSIEVHVIKNEYVAAKAVKMGANYMIRGIRNQIDFDSEALLQKANVDVIGGAKTLFVMPPRDLDSVSSSFIKSLMGPVGWHIKVKQFLPDVVYKEILKKYIYDVAMEYTPKNDESIAKMQKMYDAVVSAYFSQSRHYHNFEHIVHCLQEFKWYEANSEVQDSVLIKEQVVLAILGHDIVYGQKSEDSDEELSAQFVESTFGKDILAVSLIRDTAHMNVSAEKPSIQTQLIRSIDLAILGQEARVYSIYQDNVRKEYAQYSDKDYYAGREKVLVSLLEKIKSDVLFEHPMFKHYNEQAYKNMKDELGDIRQINENS